MVTMQTVGCQMFQPCVSVDLAKAFNVPFNVPLQCLSGGTLPILLSGLFCCLFLALLLLLLLLLLDDELELGLGVDFRGEQALEEDPADEGGAGGGTTGGGLATGGVVVVGLSCSALIVPVLLRRFASRPFTSAALAFANNFFAFACSLGRPIAMPVCRG